MVIVELKKSSIKQVFTLDYLGARSSFEMPSVETVLTGENASEKTSTFMKKGKVFREKGPSYEEELV